MEKIKKILFTLALMGMAVSTHAQGVVAFSNTSSTLVKREVPGFPLSAADPVSANAGFVQLLWAPAGTPWAPIQTWDPFQPTLAYWLTVNPAWKAVPESITAIGPDPGRFDGGTLTLPTATPGAGIEAAVIGWTGNAASFDAAVAANEVTSPGFHFYVDTGNPLATPNPELPASITGPGQFGGMYLARIIPEPSFMALFGLGAAALLMFRRRK